MPLLNFIKRIGIRYRTQYNTVKVPKRIILMDKTFSLKNMWTQKENISPFNVNFSLLGLHIFVEKDKSSYLGCTTGFSPFSKLNP
jgi:hypothetical protein